MSFTAVSGAAKDDLILSLAILALHDGGVEASGDNIAALVKATGNTVPAYLSNLFAKLVASRSIDDMLMKPGSGGGGGAAPPAAAAGAAPKAAEKKEEAPKPKADDDDFVGGGGGLFGGDDDM
jgi:ribosomal protein L12E/L44/L45/RPP1/RPP2